MSNERKERQENAQAQTATSFCAEIMQKMLMQQGKRSSCVELMSECFDPKECGDEFLGTMSQMMVSCCGTQQEFDADTQRA